jgi:S-adenosylmethionine hydrolase
MERRNPLVTLTTDFGLADGYVGTMKGVILSIVPNARLVDLTHEVTPQDVRRAAFVLYSAYPFFPPHTVHLAVVDPGVGSPRRPIALRTPTGTFVGPDNGIFTYVLAREPVEELVELSRPRFRLPEVSHTFHGRDVFAPAAAHLAAGIPLTALGPSISNPVTFPLPHLEIGPDTIVGEVLHADRFGNAITSIGRLTWAGEELALEPAFQDARCKKQEAGSTGPTHFRASAAVVVVAGQEIAGIRRTYTEVAPGEVLALVGSHGHLEIAVREGNAAARLGLRGGERVTLRFGTQ